MQRWIMHVDMDAFFASIEQRDQPELRGKPVIVGGCGLRGVVATASYEARRFGVHSAMPSQEARRRCPHGIFLPCNHRYYAKVSRQIRQIMQDFSPLIEPLSLDEAFLDVTGMEWLYPDPVVIAKQIKGRIQSELGLTASAGLAPNKFLAKVASDLRKPDGLVVVRPEEAAAFLAPLPISRLWGVGAATAKVLADHDITTIGQLAGTGLSRLEAWLGHSAVELKQLAAGQDNRPVVAEHTPKSVGNEETFEHDIYDVDEIETQLLRLAVQVAWRLRLLGLAGRTVTVKLRWRSFRTITRSRTLTEATCLEKVIYDTAKELVQAAMTSEGVRLLGITVSNLTSGSGQCSLFELDAQKQLAVAQAVDKLRAKFGGEIVSRGRLLPHKTPQ